MPGALGNVPLSRVDFNECVRVYIERARASICASPRRLSLLHHSFWTLLMTVWSASSWVGDRISATAAH